MFVYTDLVMTYLLALPFDHLHNTAVGQGFLGEVIVDVGEKPWEVTLSGHLSENVYAEV